MNEATKECLDRTEAYCCAKLDEIMQPTKPSSAKKGALESYEFDDWLNTLERIDSLRRGGGTPPRRLRADD